MNKELYKILYEMRNLEPDRAFSARTRKHILASKTSWFTIFGRIPETLRMREIGVMTVILIMAVVYFMNITQENNLIVQADEMNTSIQVKLKEIQYLIDHQPAVDEATSKKVEVLLNSATEELEKASNLDSKNPEEVLQKIQSTERILKELQSLLTQ